MSVSNPKLLAKMVKSFSLHPIAKVSSIIENEAVGIITLRSMKNKEL